MVVSTDFIKSARHRDEFVAHCPDLVIVDEAHTCVAAEGPGRRPPSSGTSSVPRFRGPATGTCCWSPRPRIQGKMSVPEPARSARPGPRHADLATRGRRQLAPCFVQRRRADIRHYLDEDTAFPDDRLFMDEPYTLSPAYRALLDDAIAYASDASRALPGSEARVAWWSAIALLRSWFLTARRGADPAHPLPAAAAATAEEADELGRRGLRTSPTTRPSTAWTSRPAPTQPGHTGGVPAPARVASRAATLEGLASDRKLAVLVKSLRS